MCVCVTEWDVLTSSLMACVLVYHDDRCCHCDSVDWPGLYFYLISFHLLLQKLEYLWILEIFITILIFYKLFTKIHWVEIFKIATLLQIFTKKVFIWCAHTHILNIKIYKFE